MIRTVIAEDSPTVRALLVELLESDPEIEVVGEAADGVAAVDLVASLAPDLVIMDIDMPRMDGLQATREIMIRAPTPILIVTAAATRSQVELSLSATQAGALHLLLKPEHPCSKSFAEQREQLLSMAKAMAGVKVVRRWPSLSKPAPPSLGRRAGTAPNINLVAIAASTGGPAALRKLLRELPPDFGVSILVVQHIARGFAAGFTSWLAEGCRLRVRLAQDGESLAPGVVYIAPDDRHLGIDTDGRIVLDDAPPIAGFRPSATRLFESVAHGVGPTAAAVVLTGMGDDGVDGLRSLYAAGGRVLVQDRESSVIYGMARAAVERGVVDMVLPLDQIAPRLVELVSAKRK